LEKSDETSNKRKRGKIPRVDELLIWDEDKREEKRRKGGVPEPKT